MACASIVNIPFFFIRNPSQKSFGKPSTIRFFYIFSFGNTVIKSFSRNFFNTSFTSSSKDFCRKFSRINSLSQKFLQIFLIFFSVNSLNEFERILSKKNLPRITSEFSKHFIQKSLQRFLQVFFGGLLREFLLGSSLDSNGNS